MASEDCWFVVAPTRRFSALELRWTPCKVVASAGDEALLASGQWVSSAAIRADGRAYAAAKAQRRLRDAASAIREVVAGLAPASARTSTARVWPDVRVERGLLSSREVKAVHSLAADCAARGRRRTVGEPDAWRAPTSTALRLTSRWRGPSYAAKLTAGDGLALKQADYLLYGAGDAAGWHDHKGESQCFLVALLNSAFTGGQFQVRRRRRRRRHNNHHDAAASSSSDDYEVVTLDLGVGDVVFCESHVEHRVLPVQAGTRASLNLDFWGAETGRLDRRSVHDL